MKTSTGWVTFMLYSSPATTWIGTSGRYLSTTEQSSVAWKLGSPAATSYARRMVESLNACGRLAAAQPGAVRDVGDELAVLAVGAGHDDRVRGRDGDVDGLVALQRVDAVVDHTLRQQRADGVVEQDVAVLALGQALAQGGDRALGGLVAGRAALDDPGDLGQSGLGDDLLDVRAHSPGAISTITSSMESACWKIVRVCSMTAFPAIFSSCLGMDRPTRWPVPPARTTAVVRGLALRCTDTGDLPCDDRERCDGRTLRDRLARWTPSLHNPCDAAGSPYGQESVLRPTGNGE